MAQQIKSKLTYANVVATIALVVAISGGATAIAITAGKNTVTTKSIKPGNVTARDLGPVKTVTKNETMTNEFHVLRVFCPPKSRVLTGGGVGGAALDGSSPVTGGWEVKFRKFEPMQPSAAVSGFVVCLSDKTGKPRNG